jgi:hypothetical protein
LPTPSKWHGVVTLTLEELTPKLARQVLERVSAARSQTKAEVEKSANVAPPRDRKVRRNKG